MEFACTKDSCIGGRHGRVLQEPSFLSFVFYPLEWVHTNNVNAPPRTHTLKDSRTRNFYLLLIINDFNLNFAPTAAVDLATSAFLHVRGRGYARSRSSYASPLLQHASQQYYVHSTQSRQGSNDTTAHDRPTATRTSVHTLDPRLPTTIRTRATRTRATLARVYVDTLPTAQAHTRPASPHSHGQRRRADRVGRRPERS